MLVEFGICAQWEWKYTRKTAKYTFVETTLAHVYIYNELRMRIHHKSHYILPLIGNVYIFS